VLCTNTGFTFTSWYSAGRGGMSTGGSGQMFAVSHRNSGAFSHRDFDTNSRAFKPLEPSSAEFARVGTYFHWLGRDAASILESRFATKWNAWRCYLCSAKLRSSRSKTWTHPVRCPALFVRTDLVELQGLPIAVPTETLWLPSGEPGEFFPSQIHSVPCHRRRSHGDRWRRRNR